MTLKPVSMKTQFSFLDYNHIQGNMNAVIEYASETINADTLTESQRKQHYIASLNKLQKSNLPTNHDKTLIEFDNDDLTKSMIKNQLLNEEDTINGKHLLDSGERGLIEERITKAMSLIKILHNDLYSLINQTISAFYIVKKIGYGGGSVSGLLGFIWLNPQPNWSILDYAENIYHEFIHNSLFLDDMVNSIFPDPVACAEEDGLVKSTILNIMRPLDKSYHAANVAIGIMHFYHMIGKIPEERNYYDALKVTLDGINEKTHLLGEQGILILKEMNHFYEKRDFESITMSLSKNDSISIKE